MKNNLLQNVDENILKQIIYISENYNPIYFCGSISLNTLGIINREIHDIDICVHPSHSENAKVYFKNLEKNKWYNFKSDKSHNNNPHNRYYINNIEHCLFVNDDIYCIEVEIKWGLKINISLPQEIIAAKRKYVKEHDSDYVYDASILNKHKKDLLNYEKIEKNILRQIKIKTLSEELRLVSTITNEYIDDLI